MNKAAARSGGAAERRGRRRHVSQDRQTQQACVAKQAHAVQSRNMQYIAGTGMCSSVATHGGCRRAPNGGVLGAAVAVNSSASGGSNSRFVAAVQQRLRMVCPQRSRPSNNVHRCLALRCSGACARCSEAGSAGKVQGISLLWRRVKQQAEPCKARSSEVGN